MRTYTPEQVTEARELAAKAAVDLETNGWHQVYYFNYSSKEAAESDDVPLGCSACALGALIRATGKRKISTALKTPALEAAEGLITEAVQARGVRVVGVGIWNDNPDTTREDVLSVLREVAEGGRE